MGEKTVSWLKWSLGIVLVLVFCVQFSRNAIADSRLKIGDFSALSEQDFTPWRRIHFDDAIPKTVFTKVRWDKIDAIRADAKASMALLARPITVDLNVTPDLCWVWRVENMLETADLNTKNGDDYAARVYIGFKDAGRRPSFFERVTKSIAKKKFGEPVPDYALTYIWDNRHAVGTYQANAYTDRTQIYVVAQGEQHMGRWVGMRRSVLADMKRVFSSHDAFQETSASARLDPVLLAIGSDTDNTGEVVAAGFAHIQFVTADEPCTFPQDVQMLEPGVPGGALDE